MIASDDPWVRQPVASPAGALKRSASIRTQRCSISAEIGYSAWSMKLRWRFSAMIRCASGSIQVVTNVARLRWGSPSIARSSSTSRMASTGRIPFSGKDCEGADSVRNRLPNSVTASASLSFVMVGSTTVLCWLRSVEFLQRPADREAHRTCERPPVDQRRVQGTRRRRARECRHPGEEEQDGAELVDSHDPPAQQAGPHPDPPVTHIEHREVPRHQEADTPEDVGQPDPSVGLPGGQSVGECRDQADREQQRPDEQDYRTSPPEPVDDTADEEDRRVAAEAEEEAPAR